MSLASVSCFRPTWSKDDYNEEIRRIVFPNEQKREYVIMEEQQ